GSGVLPSATFIASTSNNGCISWFMVFTFLHQKGVSRYVDTGGAAACAVFDALPEAASGGAIPSEAYESV
ncbi:MAG: hypothetical protein ACR2M4_07895, partial [Actinomycetota bacterium]